MSENPNHPYYSEHDEEKYILEAVAFLPTGHFLDVGAYDGVRYSNTRALVEMGWSGVMVEPGLSAFQKLLGNYAGSDKVTLVHAALSYQAGPYPPGMRKTLIHFWENEATYSTGDLANVHRFIDHQKFIGPYFTSCVNWTNLLHFGVPDVLSIDTEGTSPELLDNFPDFQTDCWPRVIIVEHEDRIDDCLDSVAGRNYDVVYQNKVNLVLVRRR